jgi:hypothetical protein
MNSKSITYIFLAFIAILGWNVFLIQRDQKMFAAYDKQVKEVCKQQAGWHPDCNLK